MKLMRETFQNQGCGHGTLPSTTERDLFVQLFGESVELTGVEVLRAYASGLDLSAWWWDLLQTPTRRRAYLAATAGAWREWYSLFESSYVGPRVTTSSAWDKLHDVCIHEFAAALDAAY